VAAMRMAPGYEVVFDGLIPEMLGMRRASGNAGPIHFAYVTFMRPDPRLILIDVLPAPVQ